MKSLRSKIDPKGRPPVKRIRFTIEWVGRCSELDWIFQMAEAVEAADYSQRTRVVEVEELTQYGTTLRCSAAELDAAMVARGHEVWLPKKPPSRGFWGALWWRVRRGILVLRKRR